MSGIQILHKSGWFGQWQLLKFAVHHDLQVRSSAGSESSTMSSSQLKFTKSVSALRNMKYDWWRWALSIYTDNGSATWDHCCKTPIWTTWDWMVHETPCLVLTCCSPLTFYFRISTLLLVIRWYSKEWRTLDISTTSTFKNKEDSALPIFASNRQLLILV